MQPATCSAVRTSQITQLTPGISTKATAQILTHACVAALLFVLLGMGAETAFAHTRLISSEPAAGATLKIAPTHVVLQFSAPPEKGFSEVQWAKEGEENWRQLDVVQQTRQLEASLPALVPGRYKIRWSVLSRDGHRQRGVLQFSID